MAAQDTAEQEQRREAREQWEVRVEARASGRAHAQVREVLGASACGSYLRPPSSRCCAGHDCRAVSPSFLARLLFRQAPTSKPYWGDGHSGASNRFEPFAQGRHTELSDLNKAPVQHACARLESLDMDIHVCRIVCTLWRSFRLSAQFRRRTHDVLADMPSFVPSPFFK